MQYVFLTWDLRVSAFRRVILIGLLYRNKAPSAAVYAIIGACLYVIKKLFYSATASFFTTHQKELGENGNNSLRGNLLKACNEHQRRVHTPRG